MINYNDHHIFRIDDLKDASRKNSRQWSERKVIITTEKDAVRLIKFKEACRISRYIFFLFSTASCSCGAAQFNEKVISFITNFQRIIPLIMDLITQYGKKIKDRNRNNPLTSF